MPPHIEIEKPKQVTLGMFVGKPVIIEPLKLFPDKRPEWKTAPWQAIVWSDNGEGRGYEAQEMLIFAKAIIAGLEKAKATGGWLGGILSKDGSQLWIDSSNPMILKMLEAEYANISGETPSPEDETF